MGDVLVKLVLTRTGETTFGYNHESTVRIKGLTHTEEDYSHRASVLLDFSTITGSSSLEGYTAVLSYGYHTGVARSAWQATTAYSLNDVVVPTTANGYQYICTTAGTSGGSEPVWGTTLGGTTADGAGALVWTLDGNTGDEYSVTAPLKVKGQELFSQPTQQLCQLELYGIPDRMNDDRASADYYPKETNTDTVKDLINAIAGATLACYSHCTAVTVVWDSEDSLIDSYTPKDTFRIYERETRMAKIKELLATTKCVAVFKADGAMHIINPTVTGSTYAYEYDNSSAAYHNMFSNSFRQRLVIPNKITIRSRTTDMDYTTGAAQAFTGNATESTSYGLLQVDDFLRMRVSSNQECTDLATAMIQRLKINAETGDARVPMNCGQEVFDYVSVTNAWQNLTGTGNVRQIVRRYVPGQAFESYIAFGAKPPIGLLLSASNNPYGFRASDALLEEREARKRQQEWYDQIDKENRDLKAQIGIVGDQILTDRMKRVKTLIIKVIADDTTLTTGDGKDIHTIGWDLNGFYLVRAHAAVKTASSSGSPTIQIRNVTQAVDMLSTRITIDANEKSSYTAATPSVVNSSNNRVFAGDEIAVDVDVAGTGTKGLEIALSFVEMNFTA